MPSQQELIALFGDDFDEVLKGLSMLPPEIRELLDNTMNKMLYDADIFANRVNKTLQTQRASGISFSATQGILATDMLTGGRVFGELKNSIKESLVEGINQTGNAGSFQAYDPDEKTLFMWVTVAGHKICQDCAPRGGEMATLKEWETRGMPGSGWSVCRGYCYCILDPSGKISPRIKMEERAGKKIQEKGATIRPKPPAPAPTKWKSKMTTKEAVEWAKNSEWQGIRYHGTTTEGLKGITKEGFDTSKVRTGQIYGKGAYSTKKTEVATAFGSEGGVVMELMYNVKKPLTIEAEAFVDLIIGSIPQQGGVGKYMFLDGYDQYMGRGKLNFFNRFYDKHLAKRELKDFNTGRRLTKQEAKAQYFGTLSGFEKKAFGDQVLEMGNKWFDYLDDLVQAGDKSAISFLDNIMENGKYDAQFNVEFPKLWADFLRKEGYDSLHIRNTSVPIPNNPIIDDYFIALDKESVTAIIDD
tara:strand:+ start:602 stop:2014 length:1413 start_codon:yes stop_codon:yes gene_type:complete